MSLFDFILSLLLIFNPGISEVDFNNVYSVLDDTSIHSIVVDDSAFDNLSQLANAGVMPLDLTSQQSDWLYRIMQALYQHGSSSSTSIFERLDDISDSLGYRLTNSSLYTQLAGMTSSLHSYLTSIDSANKSMLNLFDEGRFYHRYGNYMVNSIDEVVSGIDEVISELGSGSATDVWTSYLPSSWFDTVSFKNVSKNLRPYDFLMSLRNDFVSLMLRAPKLVSLNSDGTVVYRENAVTLPYLLNWGFLGLSSNLAGSDKVTTFSFLSSDISQEPTVVKVNNILDALGHIGTQLQNPLQRLAYVFSNPLDLEIKDNVTENTESANDNFFKPGSPGSVKPSDIGDAAGFVTGAGDLLKTDVSAGDMFTGLSHDSGFWSQTTMDGLYEGNSSYASPSLASDDGLNYDPFFSSLVVGDDGYYHFFNSDYVSDFISGGG